MNLSKKTILLSSYRCDPFGISESSTAFIWLRILLKDFDIVLLTTVEAEKSLNKYYNFSLPGNLKIIPFTDNYPFKNKRVSRDSIKLGYFFFNYKIKKYLKTHPEIINNCDIIFQKTPETFRFFTSLTYFDKPVYIGPLSGGLRIPPELKEYFKKEPLNNKLRIFDQLLLKLPFYKRQFSEVEKVLICFDYLSDILPKEYLLRKKILSNSGIDCSQYVQAVNNSNTPSILYVGRLTKYKGAELLIRAVNNIKKLNFSLDIVGDGEEKGYLKNLVQELGLEDKIKFHGFKKAEEVKEFYSSSSIFCFPSLTEAVGIVFYEAMASGLPIITIDNGGPKYICPPQGSIKIPITSEAEIIKKIEESIISLIENPGKREEMGRFNRNYCLENYDWAILEEEILKFFNDEIAKHSQPVPKEILCQS